MNFSKLCGKNFIWKYGFLKAGTVETALIKRYKIEYNINEILDEILDFKWICFLKLCYKKEKIFYK